MTYWNDQSNVTKKARYEGRYAKMNKLAIN
jgi:hypothetical protein